MKKNYRKIVDRLCMEIIEEFKRNKLHHGEAYSVLGNIMGNICLSLRGNARRQEGLSVGSKDHFEETLHNLTVIFEVQRDALLSANADDMKTEKVK